VARGAVGDWLPQGSLDAPVGDDVRLLVTELVSNAVRHACIEGAQPVRLRAWLRETMLRIEVWDAGADGVIAPGTPRLSDEGSTGGFGLNLVALLSHDWGVDRDAHGTTVWLELLRAPGAAAWPQRRAAALLPPEAESAAPASVRQRG
jgi:anti-sigma regulatory factor (Ser/Thr protein kinase)